MRALLPALFAAAAAAADFDVFVDPDHGDDAGAGVTRSDALRTVHAARDAVRSLLSAHPAAHVTVQLLPGTHHVGTAPLLLGPLDGGGDGGAVVWRSADAGDPAVLGAPIKVTGWKPHATIGNAFTAPLPAGVAKGAALRQFWVGGVRAERPKVWGHGRQQGDNRNGYCLNLTAAAPTEYYPEGSKFDFTHESATDPSKWPNPGDVEFVYTSCDAINCWIEPRCTVESVSGQLVGLHQGDNSSCFHRLYYYGKCFNNGKGPEKRSRGQNPTHIENVGTNFTQPGQFYYDRAGGVISYIPRAGETVATLEATATTATQQELLVVNATQNVRWDNVRFEYATWLGASGPKGFVDTQSAYLCLDQEPPTNVHVRGSRNVTFSACAFAHLGGVYAVGADGGSQDVVLSNNTFTDLSGGGVKLGYSGERGAPAPSTALDPAQQDRGFLVSDNLITGTTLEYSSANPIFAAYVADTHLAHNTIHDCRYSGICVGWGWGLSSYARSIRVENNSISKVMQRLADGGGVYTNVVCPDCHVSRNYMDGDPAVYGCLYHDGGSALWSDRDNVFNNVRSSAVFCHGTCPGISISPIYYNNSGTPNMQGATNMKLHDDDGVCVAATVHKLQPGAQWTGVAADVVRSAGRRAGPLPPLAPPPLSPPFNKTQNNIDNKNCVKFKARPCEAGRDNQRWALSPGALQGQLTTVKSARAQNASCWQINNCGYGTRITCDAFYNRDGSHGGSAGGLDADGCKPVVNTTKDPCPHNQAFRFNANGTIAAGILHNDKGTQFIHHCLQVSTDMSVELGNCNGQPSQQFNVTPNSDGSVTIEQDGLCVDNNYRPVP